MSDVFARMRALVAQSLAVPEGGITPDSRLITDLGAEGTRQGSCFDS